MTVMAGAGKGGGVLLERHHELERMGQCLRRAELGSGSALVVEGPAGIGKTALPAAAYRAPENKGFG